MMDDNKLLSDIKQLTVHILAVLAWILCSVIFSVIPALAAHPAVIFFVSFILSWLAFQGFKKDDKNHYMLVLCNTALIYTATLGLNVVETKQVKTVANFLFQATNPIAVVRRQEEIKTNPIAVIQDQNIQAVQTIARDPEQLKQLKSTIELMQQNPELIHEASMKAEGKESWLEKPKPTIKAQEDP